MKKYTDWFERQPQAVKLMLHFIVGVSLGMALMY